MKVLILGASGNLGPYVVKALENCHTLCIADIEPLQDATHEFFIVNLA